MSAASQLLSRLQSLGIRLAASGGRLRVSAARGGLTEEVKQAITTQKAELLDLLEEQDGAADAAPPSSALSSLGRLAPLPVPRDGRLPLSDYQERLWVAYRLDPAGVAANMVTVWPNGGAVSAAALAQAIRAVVARHEILRATFRDDEAGPYVRMLPADAAAIATRDLSALDEAAQKAAVEVAVAEAVRTPFDLAAEPPLRWTIFQGAGDRTALLVAAHHIAMDEWSFHLLRRELLDTLAGTAPPAAPALQFVDYAAWQKRARSREVLSGELSWWTRRLSGLPELCSFPADAPPSPEGWSAGQHDFGFDRELSDGIRALSRESGATLYMTLLAACAAVLHRHSGQTDIVLGSPLGARERPEFETLIGPFVNLQVQRLDLSGDPSFADLLARARNTVLDSYEHRNVTLEMLIEQLKPARIPGRSPLFQVAVVVHNATEAAGEAIHNGDPIQDLTWYLHEDAGRLVGTLEYRTDLFRPATAARFVAHLEAMLRAAVADRTQRVGAVRLLTAGERRTVLETFNDTAAPLDLAPFPLQFERSAAAHPDRVALRCGEAALSYGALNRRANQLARHLRDNGIGAGSRVGLCLERSPELLVALLAVGKSGAAYVPLDPGFPAERLSSMLADSGVAALLTAAGAARGLAVPDGALVVDLGAEAERLAALDGSDPGVAVGPGDIAYLIYTSGSTGRPNGVAVPHGALSNFLGSMRRAPGLDASRVLAAVTTVSFDIAALELYLPLLVGARIELVPRAVAADGAALAQLLEESGADALQATPATWRLLTAAGWAGRPDFLALCGGEALPRDLADAVLERVGALWNLYGPTETTIWSTAGEVARGAPGIDVGKPIANTRIYVLDSDGQPVPVGVPGEIWIGGAGVAAGYHGRPELTAERFSPEPFPGEPGARVYRTGDSGRWDEAGRLVHLGRLDHQVKVRGYRVELGEVGAALRTHPAVREAVAVARAIGDDVRLVAYLVYRPGEDLTVSEVRAHLRQTLPDYMIPAMFVPVEAMPLTPNGKLDQRALPDPFANALRAARVFEPPAPGLEQELARIWQDVLKVDRIGAEDNFFELGGHSLLTIRVADAVRRQSGLRMDPRALFFQNLRQVAAGIRDAGARAP